MIKVQVTTVDEIDHDVDVDIYEYSSYDEMFDDIINDYGDVDVNGKDIRETQYGETDILIEGDVYFSKWNVLK